MFIFAGDKSNECSYMTIDDIKKMIIGDETRTLELKKTTGELKDAMHSLCAMLNSDGGYVVIGIAPTSLRIVGQMVTDNTRQEIAREIRKLEPFVNMNVEYVDVPEIGGMQLIVLHADKNMFANAPYVFDGKPYYKLESTTMMMPQQMYEDLLRKRDVMACFRGTTKNIFVDSKFAKGNVFYMLDAGITFLMNNLKIGGKVVGLLREEKLELPIEAMREALINALCHRQIDRTLTNVTLAIYDDRVEISNPGCLPPEIPVEKIKEPHKSYPRNKLIAQVLYLTAYLERWGTGVERILQKCIEYDVPEPEWTASEYDVSITFWRKSRKRLDECNDKNGENSGENKLTERQLLIYEILKVNGENTAKSLARILSMSQRTVEREISFLRRQGFIDKDGTKSGVWRILK